MKVFTCDCFTGAYPVGTASVIVANDIIEACSILEKQITYQGLQDQTITPDMLVEVDINTKNAIILCDGDY